MHIEKKSTHFIASWQLTLSRQAAAVPRTEVNYTISFNSILWQEETAIYLVFRYLPL